MDQAKLERAALKLYNARLKWPASGFDCEGAYWIIRDNKVTRAFRAAARARLAKKKKP